MPTLLWGVLRSHLTALYRVNWRGIVFVKVSNGHVTSIAIPGHYINAHMATQASLLNSDSNKIQVFAKDFKSISLSSDEHRAMLALWSIYNEAGHKEDVYKQGVLFTAYELCNRMAYSKDKKGRFGGKVRKAALDALLSLSRRTFDVYLKNWTGKKGGKDTFDVLVMPNISLIDIKYAASNVTEEDLINGRVKGKVIKIQVRIKPFFYKEGYFMLFEANFYRKLKEVLDKDNRRLSKYHWNFAIWLLKQTFGKKTIEINVDKLATALKIPISAGHITRARMIARGLYEDFKNIEYVAAYKTNIAAKGGGTKDIIIMVNTPSDMQLPPGDVGRRTGGCWAKNRGMLGREDIVKAC
jgi:hypothetical protein